ncbi:MAG TPA: DsrE family protein [Pseudolabrys sp.]|nr:DsrE family protein [Pseudolabrys sp.]
MHRRNLLTAVLAGAGGLIAAAGGARSAQAKPAAAPDKAKVVYHLTDLDKVAFVLGNIRNHYDGAGGPDKVTIALVVHGPALKAFQTAQASPDLARHVGEFAKTGLALTACGNTMKAQKITLADLLPGFVKADEGGVVRIAELQAQGYVYLRP